MPGSSLPGLLLSDSGARISARVDHRLLAPGSRTGNAAESPLVVFHRPDPGGRLPQRADRSAAGSLPTRAFRYCEPSTSASGYGYYIFPPISFSLQWDGHDIMWTFDGVGLDAAEVGPFPGFRDLFDSVAPQEIQEFAPPSWSPSRRPGWCRSGPASSPAPRPAGA